MKQISILIMLCVFFAKSIAQQDPEAKKILDHAAEKTKSYKTIMVDFELVIEDRKEKTESKSEGQIKIKGNKYRLESMESIVYFDGKTMWTYAEDIQEVTITEPDMDDEDFLNNPAKILTWYNRDFKYRYVQKTTSNGMEMHEIDLYPKNLDQPYSRIKLFFGVKDSLLYSVKSVGKDGIDYSIKLKNYVVNKDMDDSIFVFDDKKHKKVEIIDMRI